MTVWQEVPVAVLGGDRRERVLVEHLARLGYQISVAGLPVAAGERIRPCADLGDAMTGVAAVILPMPGTNPEGQLYAPLYPDRLILKDSHFTALPEKAPVFVGVGNERLRTMVIACGLRLVEVAELDEVAVLNSVSSAEGAIQVAMEGLPITIHSSRSVVIGFGRMGLTLTRLLLALGAKVQVVARNPAARARAWEMGADTLSCRSLAQVLSTADFVFNTVPAPVLTEALLVGMNREAMIVDLASAPGGTDFRAADQMGIKAVLASGLPGKVAPKTAGEILARIYPGLIAHYLGDGGR
ncbi:MAG: dipicolinate synthase subunit DpsA [Heliobacteriaceae bacterium]|nr:dipicolinate synthase subunit DpsA [Heliobacteriaceae bacterium]